MRLDGVDVYQWNKIELGVYVGYLPQSVELLEGTVAENISRFATPNAEAVVAAARMAGVHEMILRLPEGYNTQLGAWGNRTVFRPTAARWPGARALRIAKIRGTG